VRQQPSLVHGRSVDRDLCAVRARAAGGIDLLQRLWREARVDLRDLRRDAAAGLALL
jgi:hypothetical protein